MEVTGGEAAGAEGVSHAGAGGAGAGAVAASGTDGDGDGSGEPEFEVEIEDHAALVGPSCSMCSCQDTNLVWVVVPVM